MEMYVGSSSELTLAWEGTSEHGRVVDPAESKGFCSAVMGNGAGVGCRFKRFLMPDLQIIRRRQHVQ